MTYDKTSSSPLSFFYKFYRCYHCHDFATDEEYEYLRHGVLNHLYKPMFPNEVELQQYQLILQNRQWEKPLCTKVEAIERLANWAEKRIKEEKEEIVTSNVP